MFLRITWHLHAARCAVSLSHTVPAQVAFKNKNFQLPGKCKIVCAETTMVMTGAATLFKAQLVAKKLAKKRHSARSRVRLGHEVAVKRRTCSGRLRSHKQPYSNQPR